MAKFKPFKYGEPLVVPAGNVYRCTGCSGDVRDGMLIYETVKDDMVVGIRALAGLPGPGVPVTHECGTPE